MDLVISFHLNASDGNGQGVEVLYYDQKDLAAKISAQLAKDIDGVIEVRNNVQI